MQGITRESATPVSQCLAGFALFSSIEARGADGLPDALGRGWQFDVLDAELGESIDDRVRDRRQPRRDPALTAAAHAERVCRRRHLADLRIETRQQVGTWQRVIQQDRSWPDWRW